MRPHTNGPSKGKGSNGVGAGGWYPIPIPATQNPPQVDIIEPAHNDPETATATPNVGRRRKLVRRLRAMGEAVRVPDKQGIFIPVTIAVALLTLLVTTIGVFFRAGQIVQNQTVQEINRIEMNRQWNETLKEFKGEVEKVRKVSVDLANLGERVLNIEQSMAQFTQDSMKERADLRAEQEALRRDLSRQERDRLLLKDYTEGRISHLPYRPPSG